MMNKDLLNAIKISAAGGDDSESGPIKEHRRYWSSAKLYTE